MKNGVRSSAASAFLRPGRDRKNLHISLNSLVTKVLIKNKKAIGVEYYKNGELETAYVSKEVIVAGGAMNFPQILLLSGIGPKEHLESVGVPVILDLPGVVQNFHNHLGTSLTFTVDEPDAYINNRKVAAEYVNHQTGPMSAAGIPAVAGVLATNMMESDYPDMELNFLGYAANCAPGEVGALRSNGKRNISILVSYLHPRSRGKVTLASKNPFEYPILHGWYIHDRSRGPQGRVYRATDRPKIYWGRVLEIIQFNADSGSCKMGPASDPLAVVDSQLRVHGIEGLRVADAPIMPRVTSGNTEAPTIMIGERAAHFMKKYWSR